MKDEMILAVAAIIIIGTLGSIAIFKGINGVVLASVFSAITGIVAGALGYSKGKGTKEDKTDEKG